MNYQMHGSQSNATWKQEAASGGQKYHNDGSMPVIEGEGSSILETQ